MISFSTLLPECHCLALDLTGVREPAALLALLPATLPQCYFSSFSSLGLWELLCAGFPAGLHARVILDGAACQPRELGDVRDVLSVLVVW